MSARCPGCDRTRCAHSQISGQVPAAIWHCEGCALVALVALVVGVRALEWSIALEVSAMVQ